MEQQKKKLFKRVGFATVIIIVLAIGFVAAMLNLETGCDKLEIDCNVIVYDKVWCAIQYDNLDHYTYQCPYNGPECESGNTTMKCYQRYKCPETTCENEWALSSVILLGVFGGTFILACSLDFVFKWCDYKESKRMHDNRANNNHGPRDTIVVSSDSA